MNILFQNQHYLVSAKLDLLVVERKRVPNTGNRGRYMTGADANKWAFAFTEDKQDKHLCAAYCRALLN
jgi:hypothetical protein